MWVSSLRNLAGLRELLDESCGNDVEDELALELDDNPGKTMGTNFSVFAQNSVPIIGQMWLLTSGPHSKVQTCSSQSLPNDRTAGVSSRICTVTKSSRS